VGYRLRATGHGQKEDGLPATGYRLPSEQE